MPDLGTHTITYTYQDANGCTGIGTNTIEVTALPIVTFTGTLTAQCVSSTTYVLTGGNPLGGTYSGPGVTGTNFDASASGGAGTKTITYSYLDANGCTISATNTIVVSDLPSKPVITPDGPLTFCAGMGLSVNLTSSPGTTYQWSNGAITQSINVANNGTFTVALPMQQVV